MHSNTRLIGADEINGRGQEVNAKDSQVHTVYDMRRQLQISRANLPRVALHKQQKLSPNVRRYIFA